MDEPFGAIDPINREVIQDEFLKMHRRLKKTVMFVSHDIDEAVKMADKIAIFRAGKLEQFDSPDNILAHPASTFIADFVGTDRTLKRLRLVKVADAMQPQSPRVSGDEPVEQAVALMNEHGHEFIVDRRLATAGRTATCDLEALRDRAGPVGEHRAPLPATVRVEDDLRAAVSMMFMHDVRWLACVDRDGAFAGFITQPRHHANARRNLSCDRQHAALMAIRSVMSGRWMAAIALAVAFALGVVAQRGGLIDQIGKYRSDILFLTRQHMQLVAISGGLAIAVGVPLGMWLSRAADAPRLPRRSCRR